MRLKAKDLRKFLDVRNKENCFVCGRHSKIAHLSYLITLKECAFWANTIHQDNLVVEVPQIWLCPNHHSYYLIISEKDPSFLSHLSPREIDRYKKLIDLKIQWYDQIRNCISGGRHE